MRLVDDEEKLHNAKTAVSASMTSLASHSDSDNDEGKQVNRSAGTTATFVNMLWFFLDVSLYFSTTGSLLDSELETLLVALQSDRGQLAMFAESLRYASALQQV